jgi:hypothetical protein
MDIQRGKINQLRLIQKKSYDLVLRYFQHLVA